MVRVLHVLGGLGLGGAESRIMDLYRHIDREQVQFDFLLHSDEKENRTPQHYDEEALALGAHIYVLPKYKVFNESAYKKACHKFFSEHHDYNVVQGHMTSTASIYLPIAEKYRNVDSKEESKKMVTVAHTRNAGVDAGLKGLMTKHLRKSLPNKADFLFACSHLAGDETFGGAAYTYIPNTIDTARFKFCMEDRNTIRDRHDIPHDAVVIGNVARFSPQKNQKFLVEACEKILKINKELPQRNVYLLLCGDGALKEEAASYAKEIGVSNKVVFAGNQREVWKYYSAMDIYAFPSSYEGLPGVMVEAQASGLKCVMSDTITTDVLLTDACESLSISSSTIWDDRLNELVDDVCKEYENKSVEEVRQKYVLKVREAGFDVNDQAGKMMKFYLNPVASNLPEV